MQMQRSRESRKLTRLCQPPLPAALFSIDEHPDFAQSLFVNSRLIWPDDHSWHSPLVSKIFHRTGDTLITLARQSRRFWQAAGLRFFVMQNETAVRKLLPQLTVISPAVKPGFASRNALLTSCGGIENCCCGLLN